MRYERSARSCETGQVFSAGVNVDDCESPRLRGPGGGCRPPSSTRLRLPRACCSTLRGWAKRGESGASGLHIVYIYIYRNTYIHTYIYISLSPLSFSEFITGQKRGDNLMENCELQSAPATVPIFRLVSRTRGNTSSEANCSLHLREIPARLYIFHPLYNQLHRNEGRRAPILILHRIVKEPRRVLNKPLERKKRQFVLFTICLLFVFYRADARSSEVLKANSERFFFSRFSFLHTPVCSNISNIIPRK